MWFLFLGIPIRLEVLSMKLRKAVLADIKRNYRALERHDGSPSGS